MNLNISKKIRDNLSVNKNEDENININKNNENENENETEIENEIYKKLDVLLLNNGWNDKNEKFIVSIGENSASYKYMHEKISKSYIIIDNIIKIFITITSILISADSFINIFEMNDTVIILNKIITFLLAIISIVYNFLNYAQLSSDHTHSASSFGLLYHDIRNIMCLYRKDRPNAVKYIQHSIKQYDHLEVSGPNIPNYILNQFKKTFKNTDISIPDIADKIQKIDIIVEPNKINEHSQLNNSFILNNQSNLSQINDSFKIDGDLSETDFINSNNKTKNKLLEYQLKRFMNDN